jgi:AbrB family looped-hinge helix DNA binding protein
MSLICYAWYVCCVSHPAGEITVGDRGRVVLPASIRSELGLTAGTRMVLNVEDDGSLRLRPYRVIAERLTGIFADVAPGESLADELVAERRAEARREAAGE